MAPVQYQAFGFKAKGLLSSSLLCQPERLDAKMLLLLELLLLLLLLLLLYVFHHVPIGGREAPPPIST